jgi:hypothetical protein
MMPGSRGAKIADLALDPNVAESSLQSETDIPVDFRDAVNFFRHERQERKITLARLLRKESILVI